jgi:glycosyltransferase involved in cell wall biosynthesis
LASILYGVSSVHHPDAVAIVRRARAAGLRFVLNQNGVYYPAWFGAEWAQYNRPLAALLAEADHVVYQSEFCRRSANRFLGDPPGTSSVMLNPVDLNHFRPVPAPSGRITMLVAAADATRRDRVELAVQCLAELVRQGVDAALLFAGYSASHPGDAAMMRALEGLARQAGLGGRLAFHPRYVRADGPAVFGRAHLLLHPVYNDPSPNFVGEALASGLPVAYSATGGTPEIVGPAGEGVATEESWERMHYPSAAALAGAVIRIVSRLDELRLAARWRAEAVLDLGAYVEAHRELFTRLEQA